jgi:hypothetical protein
VAPVDPGESVEPPDDLFPRDWGDDDEPTPRPRPSWWRWVAIAVIVAMVVAGPFAFVLYKLLT